MSGERYLLYSLAALVLLYVVLRLIEALRVYLQFRGNRLVTCPETRRPAGVRVAAVEVAEGFLVGRPQLRLSECSRWPERADCGQDCLSQVEADPQKCLVWNIVNQWYAGKSCVYCKKPFGEIHWHDHRPALVDQDLKTVQWTQVPIEQLPELLDTHRPVCWDCHIAESFHREHPELVTDRPWKRRS